MKYLFKFTFLFLFFALVSRHGVEFRYSTRIPPEFDGMWGTDYLNTMFSLPTLLRAGYSVKLIYLFILIIMMVVYLKYLNNSKLEAINPMNRIL